MKLEPPKHHLELQNPREALQTCGPEFGHFDHLRAVIDWTKGGTTSHHSATRTGLGGAPPPDSHAGQISRPTAAGRFRIGPAKRRRRAPWVTGIFLIFWPFQAISGHPIAPFHHFWTPELISVVHFCRFLTV